MLQNYSIYGNTTVLLYILLTTDAFAESSETNPNSLRGLNFGVGLALTLPVFDWDDPEILAAEVDGNNIVRVTQEAKRTPKIVLESHYFFAPPGYMRKLGCTESTCGHGPYVAIEADSSSNPIKSYSIGYMIGFKRTTTKEQTSNSSWNIGFGYVATPEVQFLGDGIVANEIVPANDVLRFKTESRAGLMILTSFTF